MTEVKQLNDPLFLSFLQAAENQIGVVPGSEGYAKDGARLTLTCTLPLPDHGALTRMSLFSWYVGRYSELLHLVETLGLRHFMPPSLRIVGQLTDKGRLAGTTSWTGRVRLFLMT